MKNDLNVKLISMEDIMETKCCDIQEVIRVIEEVLVDYKNGGVMLPDKISQIFNLETQDRINCMPSTLMKDGVCGIKWVSVFPENPHKFSSQNVSGVIILSELEQGFPIAVMDGTLITALRTACMGAIGAKYLARKDSHIYGTIGSGEQAKAHFVAIKQMFPQIDTCYVASRSGKGENQFIDIMKKKYPDVDFSLSDFKKETDLVIYFANMKVGSNQTTIRITWDDFLGESSPKYVHDLPYLFLSFSNPYHLVDVPMVKTHINAYTCNEYTVRAMVEKLMGRSDFKGTSPVDPFAGLWDTKL